MGALRYPVPVAWRVHRDVFLLSPFATNPALDAFLRFFFIFYFLSVVVISSRYPSWGQP